MPSMVPSPPTTRPRSHCRADLVDRQRGVAGPRPLALVRLLDEDLAALGFEKGADAFHDLVQRTGRARARRKPGTCRSVRRAGSGMSSANYIIKIVSMLDDRAKLLLKTLVERYIAEGQPVGSRTLSRASGLELSPATIRNVMSDLEGLGLIASPHTSAGRIPTARGYRLFVDTMLTAQREHLAAPSLPPDQPQKVIANAAQPAVEPVAVRRRGDGAAPRLGVPPDRVPAPVGAPPAGDHRLARRRRAEPGDLPRGRLLAVAAGRGIELHQRALRGPVDRAGARSAAVRGGASCAARSRR